MWGSAVDLAYQVQSGSPQPGVYVTSRVYDAMRDSRTFTAAGEVTFGCAGGFRVQGPTLSVIDAASGPGSGTINIGGGLAGVGTLNVGGTGISGACVVQLGATGVTSGSSVTLGGSTTLTVGTGLTTLGGALTVAGTTTFNGPVNVATGQAVTLLGTGSLIVGVGGGGGTVAIGSGAGSAGTLTIGAGTGVGTVTVGAGTGQGLLTLANLGRLTLSSDNATQSFGTTLASPAGMAANVPLTLPSGAPTTGQVLSAVSATTLGWATSSGVGVTLAKGGGAAAPFAAPAAAADLGLARSTSPCRVSAVLARSIAGAGAAAGASRAGQVGASWQHPRALTTSASAASLFPPTECAGVQQRGHGACGRASLRCKCTAPAFPRAYSLPYLPCRLHHVRGARCASGATRRGC